MMAAEVWQNVIRTPAVNALKWSELLRRLRWRNSTQLLLIDVHAHHETMKISIEYCVV